MNSPGGLALALSCLYGYGARSQTTVIMSRRVPIQFGCHFARVHSAKTSSTRRLVRNVFPSRSRPGL